VSNNLLRSFLGAVSSGILLTLCFPSILYPGYNLFQSLLIWIALVPLFWAIDHKSPIGSFLIGLLSGFLWFMGLLYWVADFSHGINSLYISNWLLLSLYSALFVGLFGFLANFLINSGWSDILVLPTVWVLWEFLRSMFTFGHPWGFLAHTLHNRLFLLPPATTTGLFGLSYLIVIVNALVFKGVKRIFLGPNHPPTLSEYLNLRPVYSFNKPFLLSLNLILALLIGLSYSGKASPAPVSRHKIKVAVIQGNRDTQQEWDEDYKTQTLSTFLKLTDSALAENPELVIWPESAFPGILTSHEDYLRAEMVFDYVQKNRINLILPSDEREYQKDRARYYNTIFYITHSGELSRYRKIRLVPFGEYVPRLFSLTHDKAIQQPFSEDYEFGRELTLFNINGVVFNCLICYEDATENLYRKFIKKGSQFVIVSANDSWGGRTALAYQRNAMTVFLAVQCRRYVIRANMRGITSIIGPSGKVINSLVPFQEDFLTAEIEPLEGLTFFAKYGHLFGWMITVLVLCMLVLSLWVRQRRESVSTNWKEELPPGPYGCSQF